MKLANISLLTTGLASTGIVAAPTSSELPGTSPNLVARGIWMRDECFPTRGTSIGGSTLWMLRNTWSNRFGGDFSGGKLNYGGYKGVCCWGQCLFVQSEGQGRDWSSDAWGNALSRLTKLVGDKHGGLCGARVNNDPYLVLMTVQHDGVSIHGQKAGVYFGDTCAGRPPW